MRVFFVDSDLEGGMHGPYSKASLAETALKIVQMTKDEAAELVSCDMYRSASSSKPTCGPSRSRLCS